MEFNNDKTLKFSLLIVLATLFIYCHYLLYYHIENSQIDAGGLFYSDIDQTLYGEFYFSY